MTVKTGVLILAAALAGGFAIGFVVAVAADPKRKAQDIKSMGDAFSDTIREATPEDEVLFRKGGPPTPEAKANTDTPDTTGS